MPIDFPSNPTVGQVYSFSNRSWTWNGSAWASSNTSSLSSAIATFLSSPTSTNLHTAISGKTGTSSSNLVFSDSPILTNATIGSSTITNGVFNGGLFTTPYLNYPSIRSLREISSNVSISAGAVAINCTNGNLFEINMTSNITSFGFTNLPNAGEAYGFILSLVFNGTATTITWPSSVKWASAVAPTLSSTNLKRDIFILNTWDAGTNWYAFVGGQNL